MTFVFYQTCYRVNNNRLDYKIGIFFVKQRKKFKFFLEKIEKMNVNFSGKTEMLHMLICT